MFCVRGAGYAYRDELKDAYDKKFGDKPAAEAAPSKAAAEAAPSKAEFEKTAARENNFNKPVAGSGIDREGLKHNPFHKFEPKNVNVDAQTDPRAVTALAAAKIAKGTQGIGFTKLPNGGTITNKGEILNNNTVPVENSVPNGVKLFNEKLAHLTSSKEAQSPSFDNTIRHSDTYGAH